jgi:tetratricopeptide (TPR) repeat protein
LRFPPPSSVQNEIRNDFRWLDALILRCLEVEPSRRFASAAHLLEAIEACEKGEALPPLETAAVGAGLKPDPTEPMPPADAEMDALFREVRKLLASKAYAQVIDRLDIHRPAEWAVLNLMGARTLRALGQAYLGRGELNQARECLEQLRTAQGEQAMLSKADFAAALSDLFKCYRALGQMELAQACQEEARNLM